MTSVVVAPHHRAPAGPRTAVSTAPRPAAPPLVSMPPESMVPRPPPDSPLLTTDQVAAYLQISVRSVKSLLSDGKIPFIKLGRTTRIHRDDLDEFIARSRRRQRQPLRSG